MPSPTTWISWPRQPAVISTPAISCRRPAAASRASARPAVVSWSVSASTETPRTSARSTSSAGGNVPSEQWLWVCRSMRASTLPVSYGPMSNPVRIPDHIDTLLLDLDGTLLDLAFDTHFWLEVVPEYYGRTRGMSAQDALEKEITPRLRRAEGTLDWYSLDYWSRMLELDLSKIKSQHDERIAWLPGAQDFLRRQR